MVLDRSNQVKQKIGPLVYSSTGVFGSEKGNETWNRDVIVNVQGVTLRNMTIYGNLLLGEGIGEGNVTLQNVKVLGATTVNGGGSNSIHFESSTITTLIIKKANGEVRIVAKGTTSVQEVEVHSAVKLEEEQINGVGFTRVVLLADLAEGTEVELIGDFQEVQVNSKNTKVQIIQGTIYKMYVTEGATGSLIYLGQQVNVKDLVLDAVAQVSGQGTIEKATVNGRAGATTFEKKPSTLNDQTITTTTFGGGGGGGGSSGSSGSNVNNGSNGSNGGNGVNGSSGSGDGVTQPQTQPDDLTFQAAVIGHNKLGITFSKSVIPSSVSITLKNSSIEVDRVDYSGDNRNATLILKAPLTEGSYTIVVQQKLTDSVRTIEQNIMVENERVTFSYLYDSVIWNASSPAYIKVKYKLMNQYGEDVTAGYSRQIKFSFYPDITTSDHPAADNGSETLQYHRPLNENEKLFIYAFLGTTNQLKKEMVVSREGISLTSPGITFVTPSFEVKGLYHPTNKVLTVISSFQEYSILFRWKGETALLSENFYTNINHSNVLNVRTNTKGPEFGTLTIGNENWSSLTLTRGNSPYPGDVIIYLVDKSSGVSMKIVVTVFPIGPQQSTAEAFFIIGNQLITKYTIPGYFSDASWTLNGSVSQAVYQAQYSYSQQDIAVFAIQGGTVPSGLYTATLPGSSSVYKTFMVGTTTVNGAVYGKVYYNGGSEVTTVINESYLDPNAPLPSAPLAVNDIIRVFYGNKLLLKATWNGAAWSLNEMKPINAPSNVTASAKSKQQVRVSWAPVESADYYKIYTSSTETGEYKPLLDAQGSVIKTKETTILDDTLQPNTKRYYLIKAAFGGTNWEVESNASAAVAATTYYNEHIQLDFLVTDSVQHPIEPILYLTDKENLKLYAVNYETGSINSVSLALPPESVTFADGKIYVSLLKGAHSYYWGDEEQSGAVAIVDSTDLSLSRTFDVNIDPYDIAVDRSGYIYIASGSGQWTSMKSYSPTVFSEVYSTRIRQASYIHMHPILNRIYTITTDTSPRDIIAYNLQNGTLTSGGYDSPYHGDYAMNTEMRISPDGEYLFNGAGTVFQAREARSSDMKYVYSLNTDYTDITFDINKNRFYTVKDKLIGAYQYDNFEQFGKYPTDGLTKSLYSSSNKLFAISTISGRSVIEVVYKNDMQTIPPIVRQGIYLHGAISDIVSGPNGQKAYALDEAFHKLYVVNLVDNTIERTISLTYKPSELTVSEDGTKLYIRNNDENVLVTEISLSNFTQRYLSYQAPLDYNDPAHGQIYQRGQFLYVVTGEWAPRLLVFNASTFQKVNYGAELESIGNIAFARDNSKLYYWFQYGWSAGLAGTDVYEISISNTPFTQTSRTNIGYPDFKRDPLDTPTLLLEDRGLVIVKDRILSKNQLNQTIAVMPEPIYAVSPDSKMFVGKNGLYDAQSYQKLRSISLSGARNIFFANGKLYYLDGSSLKQLEYK